MNQNKFLSNKQELFCIEYLKTKNATDAYRKTHETAKLLTKSVNQSASRLLKKVNIQSRILELTSKLTGSSVLTIEKHLENLKEIGDSAFRADKWTAAIQAEHLRGQVCGFYVPRTEVLSASLKIAEQRYVLNLAGATDEEVSKYLHTIGLFGEGYDPNP